MTPIRRLCHNCRRAAILTDHLCPSCASAKEAYKQAIPYVWPVVHAAPMLIDKSAIYTFLTHLAAGTGLSAPLILQAVADRAGWLSYVDYPAVELIGLAEARALIPGYGG